MFLDHRFERWPAAIRAQAAVGRQQGLVQPGPQLVLQPAVERDHEPLFGPADDFGGQEALARARQHLDHRGVSGEVTLIITGGLRTPADFAKALALGADAVAVSNAAIQAIGCIGMRACHTNNCPVGIATQKEHLRARLEIAAAAQRLANFFTASTELMKVLARACGHTHLSQLDATDLTTWNRDMAYLSGVAYGGVVPL